MRISLRAPAILLTAAGATYIAYKARNIQYAASFLNGFSTQTNATSTTAASPISNHTMARGAVIALSHGGGPMPILGDPESANLVKSLKTRAPAILGLDDPARRPKAIVLVTAHWSENRPTISSGARHRLLYDYGGFPAEAYRLKYDAPGSPEIANRVAELFREEGLNPALDPERGWDHGVFVPMLLVRPQADIPIVQISVLDSEDPAQHFAMGRALEKLRSEQNVAIVGSGFASFHNLRLMFSGATRQPTMKSTVAEWNAKIGSAVEVANAGDRDEEFRNWRSWPGAYTTHPRGGAEHFLPLVVCAGAAGDESGKSYSDNYLGIDIVSYYWE